MTINTLKPVHFFITAVLLSLTLQLNAQVELKNKIVDFTTFLPIESASVYIQNTATGTVSNSDGKFALQVPKKYVKDTLVISSIGFKTFKIAIADFDASMEIFLEEEVASLDEIVIVAETRSKDGNDIVSKAIENLSENLPDSSYIQKGFLRHKERNGIEFKWLIESAITVYDSGYASNPNTHLKVNVDEMRKSYDLRDVDSIFTYVSYSNRNKTRNRIKQRDIKRENLSTTQIQKAIKWNDTRVNGLHNIFQGKLNLLRTSNTKKALFGDNMLDRHNFVLDTILVDNGRRLYKIKIDKGNEFIGLGTKGIYNEGYEAKGWLYIYYDNYAIKKIEYELVAASENQKNRSKSLFGTQTNHKLVISYLEFEERMYPNYIYYETPKLVRVGPKADKKLTEEEKERYNREERYYYTIQEILFSDIILDSEEISKSLNKKWDSDIFSPKPYNKEFWKNYNVLLESEEEEQLIEDLSTRASLYKD